jgi:hypothetical protein
LRICALFSTLIAIPSAVAQVNCSIFTLAPQALRQEGLAEAAADVIISCLGRPTGAQTGPQTVSVAIDNAPLASRWLDSAVSVATEAALLINSCASNCPAGQNPVQGHLENGVLVFSGFNLPADLTSVLNITNIRVNPSQIASNAFVTGTISATFPLQNGKSRSLGYVRPSLSVKTGSSISSFPQCQPQTTNINNLTVAELYISAFRSRASDPADTIPGQWRELNNSESQTVLSTLLPGWITSGIVPGQADAATRIRVNVSNIPAGVTVTLPVTADNGAGGRLVASSGGELGAFSAAPGLSIPLTLSGSVVYEVRATSIQQQLGTITSFDIPMTVSGSGNVGAGTIMLSATYSPTGISTTYLIPRFTDTSHLTPLFNVLT